MLPPLPGRFASFPAARVYKTLLSLVYYKREQQTSAGRDEYSVHRARIAVSYGTVGR